MCVGVHSEDREGIRSPGATHMAAENWTAAEYINKPSLQPVCSFTGVNSTQTCLSTSVLWLEMWRRDSVWLVSTKAQHSINWHDSTHLRGQHCGDAGRHATQHCSWLQKHSSLGSLDTPAGKPQQVSTSHSQKLLPLWLDTHVCTSSHMIYRFTWPAPFFVQR